MRSIPFTLTAPVEITLQSEQIAIVSLPIQPEPALGVPPIIERVIVWMELITTIETFAVNAILEVVSDLPAVSCCANQSINVSGRGGNG